MTEFEARFDTKNWEDFLDRMTKRFGEIATRKKSYVDLLTPIAKTDVLMHFDEQRGPRGKWARWSESYAKQMRRLGKANNKILQDSGKLKNTFRQARAEGRKEGVFWINPATTRKGFPYAFAHNEGGSKLPQRQFMWLSARALHEMGGTTLRYMIHGS